MFSAKASSRFLLSSFTFRVLHTPPMPSSLMLLEIFEFRIVGVNKHSASPLLDRWVQEEGSQARICVHGGGDGLQVLLNGVKSSRLVGSGEEGGSIPSLENI